MPDQPVTLSVASLINDTSLNYGLVSAGTYDLTRSSLVVGQVTPGDFTVASSLYSLIFLMDDTNDYWVGFLFNYTTGDTSAQYSDGTAHLVSAPYDPTGHRYIRVGEESGQVYWQTSPDGAGWNPMWAQPTATVGTSIDLTSLTIKVGNATNANEASSTSSVFDVISFTSPVS